MPRGRLTRRRNHPGEQHLANPAVDATASTSWPGPSTIVSPRRRPYAETAPRGYSFGEYPRRAPSLRLVCTLGGVFRMILRSERKDDWAAEFQDGVTDEWLPRLMRQGYVVRPEC